MSNRLYHWLEEKAGPGLCCGTLVELGPGDCWIGQHLLRKNSALTLVGVGFTEQQRRDALAQADAWGIRTRVQYQSGDMPEIALGDETADAVVSFGALHHWRQPLAVLNEVSRILKKEGLVYIGDARQDAAWWQIPWSANTFQSTRTVYRERKQSRNASDLRLLLSGTELPVCRVSVSGPDFWITREA